MRVGIVILPDLPWSQARRRWELAEKYGFAHAWTYDHLGWRDLVDGPWYDAVPTLMAAASATRSICLGTLVASPNFRHPVHFAREVTALDDFSGGRVSLGIGAGGVGFDAAVLGGSELPPGERATRLEEFVELLDLVLRNDSTTWQGRYYAAVDARSAPGCVQRPRVPFLVAANGPRTMRLAARLGEGWVTTGPKEVDLETWWRGVGESLRRFEDIASRAGRDPSTVERHLSLDSAPLFSLSSVEYFAEAVGRAAELGYTHAHTHWPRPSGWYAGEESVLEEAAARGLASPA